ncbi:MAG: hypothetical protein A2V93_07650 [Ignavibacteria bacterium RBG_16_34_14]|nr:MAG: hypothetical protein A2V93_07650 [Ignavibacteria bacterium RBG_16_34_14]
MKKMFRLYFLFTSFFLITITYSQENSFKNLLIQKEFNPLTYFEAKKAAINQDLPVSIKLPRGILIDILKEEKGTIFYSVIKNLAQPFSDGEILTFNEIISRYDLSNADINWGYPSGEVHQQDGLATELLLIPDWTNDNVLSFDPVTGDLVNANYIPPNPGNLASPKHALLNPAGFISVSDQITDLVQKFDTSGNYIGIYAPAGGVNNTILDNLRGHSYRPNGNLVVTVGSGANQNGIPEFDAAGNSLGNFIANGAGGLNSPFCILFRDNDVLVTGSSSDAAHRYDLSGNYLNNLITGVQFPQQIIKLSNGNLALAIFSTPSGLGIYDSLGVQLNFFTQVTGLRGVFQLPGGNYLVTNASGLHEIDGTNGNLVRTIYSSSNMQYISYVDYSIIPVELIFFSANVIGNNVVLNWRTATELNNSGFQVERSADNLSFASIGFVPGLGTTTELKNYSFTDNSLTGGIYYYRLKQVDFDGSFNYSNVVRADVEIPKEFSLSQNYPNPFNPLTKIKFALPVDSRISIKIFNSIGEVIDKAAEDNFSSGVHEINYNGLNLSSGIYFYTLEAIGNNGSVFLETKKMTVLK